MATTNQSLRQLMSIKSKVHQILSLSKCRQTLSLSKGFTLVEVLVIAPVVILVIGGFVGAIIAMTGNVLSTRSANKLIYDVQGTLNRIEADVRQSDKFLVINKIGIQEPQGKNDIKEPFEATDPALIINSYATDKNPIDDTHKVLLKTGDSSPLIMEIVYFVNNGTLWRRVIAPADYEGVAASIPWQQPSCKKNYTKTFCKANDMRLVDGVGSDGFKIEYLEHGTDIPTDAEMASVKTIKITITAKGGTAGREYSETGTIRATIPG